MKKITGILGIAVIAMAMFFSTNNINGSDTNLASLIGMNTANAEGTDEPDSSFIFGTASVDNCVVIEFDYSQMHWDEYLMQNIPKQINSPGKETNCPGWKLDGCWRKSCQKIQ